MVTALVAVLAIVSLLQLLLALRMVVGYPDPGRKLRGMGRSTYAFVKAAGETLFPPGGALPPSSEDVDVPGYLDGWLADLPPRQQLMIKALFLGIEQGTLLWGPGLSGKLRRCSGLSVEQRVAYLGRIEQHPLFFVRALLAALRTIFSFAYLDREPVQEALGIEPMPSDLPPSRHLRPDTMGEGQLVLPSDRPDEVELDCDVVVVGTGAGGGVAARQLARAGLDVVVLEEGPFVRPEDVHLDTGAAMTQVLAEAGLRTFLAPAQSPPSRAAA